MTLAVVLLSWTAQLLLVGCTATNTGTAETAATNAVTSENATTEATSWTDALKLKADKFAAWIVTDSGKNITTKAFYWVGRGVFALIPNDTLSASTKLTIANEMFAVSKFFYSLEDGTATTNQIDGSIKSFGPTLSTGDYAGIFELLQEMVGDGLNALKGYPDACNALLDCAAHAAYDVAVSRGATGSNG